MATTDFDSWLDQADPETTEEIYSLYEAVSQEKSDGIWDVSKINEKLFIKIGHANETLLIASDKAKSIFLKILKEQYMNGASDVESWYGFQRNMDNPKA